MLRPLQEWICDCCGEVIKSAADGWLEWRDSTDSKKRGFRIVHGISHSPRGNCQYSHEDRGGDLYLSWVTGPEGLVRLTSWIDCGEWNNPDYSGPTVGSLREWTTIFRRLHLPYYEEARKCTNEIEALINGGTNEIALFIPETLKQIIEKHASR